jgi:hypothetical protein
MVAQGEGANHGSKAGRMSSGGGGRSMTGTADGIARLHALQATGEEGRRAGRDNLDMAFYPPNVQTSRRKVQVCA